MTRRLIERASERSASACERQAEREDEQGKELVISSERLYHFKDDVGIARGMACGAIHHRLLVMHMRPPTYVERQVACDNATANS